MLCPVVFWCDTEFSSVPACFPSLQGANAQNLFQRLLLLCGLGCLQMVDMTLRRERLEPQKLSKQVQQGMRKW